MKKRFPYYPIYIDIEDRNVLIVGGGTVCARKAETMMRYGGRVSIVSPSITDALAAGPRGGRRRPGPRAHREGGGQARPGPPAAHPSILRPRPVGAGRPSLGSR